MILKYLLFLLSLGPSHTNDDVVAIARIRSLVNHTWFYNCSDSTIASSPSTFSISSSSSPTSTFWTTEPPSTTVSTTPSTTPETPSLSTNAGASTSQTSGAPSSLSTGFPSSWSTTTAPSPLSSSSTQTSVLPKELTTVISTGSDPVSSSAAFSTERYSPTIERTTFIESAVTTETVSNPSTTTETIQEPPSLPSSASPSRPSSPSIPTSGPPSSVSLLSILSSQSTDSLSSSSPSSSSNTPTTTSTTPEGKPSSTAYSSSSSSADLFSAAAASTKLGVSTTTQGISTLTPSTTSSSTRLETTGYATEGMSTTTSGQTSSAVTGLSSGPSKHQSTEARYTTTPEGTSHVTTRVYSETTDVPSTASSEATITSTITSTTTESTEFVTSEYSSSTLTPTARSSVTSTSPVGETTEKTSSTTWSTETTTVTPTEGFSTLSSTTNSAETTTSEYFSLAPSIATKSTQPTFSPTSRLPIPGRRTPPGQGQQHPATSTELPKTTGKGTSEKVILEGRRTAPVEKKTTVILSVSMATTLKEILSGRRWVTPVRPVIPTTPTASAWISTSTQNVETSGSTGIPSTVSSKKPSTPWELPMTTTDKIIWTARRNRTPEKSGLEMVSTVTSTDSGKTTGISTARFFDQFSASSEKNDSISSKTTGSSSVSFDTTTSIEIPSSSTTSTQVTSSSTASLSSQSSETTSPVLTTTITASLTSDMEILEEATVSPLAQTTESTKVTTTTTSSTDSPSSTLNTIVEKEKTTLISKQTTETSTAQPTSTVTQEETSSTGTIGKLTIGHDEATVTQSIVGTTVLDGLSSSSAGTTTTEKKETAIGQETVASQSTTQKLEVTSLPFSSAPWTTSESAVPSTSSQRSGTKPTGTTAGQTNLKPTATYGEGCNERCPQGTLSGSGRCYQIVPVAYQPKFHSSLSYCSRNRTGHLMEPAELMKDILIVRPWLASAGYEVNNLSLYLGPFKSEGNKIFGMYTNLSRVSVELAPTETIKMSEVKNFVGICVLPEFCSTFNCSFGPLYDSLPGMLESPMPEPVVPGTTVRVQCLSPSNTVIQLRCDTFGMMTPRPGTPPVTCKISKSFGREKPVSDNKPVRDECDCYEQGTETCDAVQGGFKCSCKRNWLKHTCWKSDDACWVPSNHPDKCNGKGTCHSYPDKYVCQCEAGFGGKNCQLPVNNCTWFGGPDSTPFFNAGKVAIVTVTSMEAVEMVLKVMIKCAALISTDGPKDPLSYTNAMRKYSVGVAGVIITVFGHPNFFYTLYGFGARLVFFLVNVLMLWSFWCLIMEAYVTFTVYFGIGRNRWTLGVEEAKEDNWCESEEPKDKWYLDKSFMIYPGMVFAIVVELAIFSWFYNSIPSPYTTLGEISSLRSPAALANLLLMAIMAYLASGIGFFSQVAKKFYPGVMGEQRDFFEFHKGRVAIEVLNKVERCQWLQPVQAPVVFAAYALAVWSQDQVATGLEQTLEFYISAVIIFCSVMISVVGMVCMSPWVYGHVMKFVLPRHPWLKIWTVYTPAEHGYLNHEEVINRKKGKDVVLPENQGWPSHPSEDSYVSLERRHQCQRRLTRQYLEMRLMGVVKVDAIELISARFKLAIPEEDPEEEQWLDLLKKWSEAVTAMDTTIFEIPRDRAMTREQYWTRILSANLFTRADVMRENSDWMRLLFLFQIMGHIPLEEPEVEGHYPQIKHILQTPEFQSAWERISRQGTKKANKKMRKVVQKISPELFPNAKKIRKLRAKARQPHTVLADLPGVRRYLTVDFLNRFFFVSEQARFRFEAMKDQKFFEPSEQKMEKMRIKVLKRRVVPQAITLTSQGEWLAGEDLITMNQPKAAALIGGNDQPRQVKKVPPLVGEAIAIPAGVIEHNGYPLSLYRW